MYTTEVKQHGEEDICNALVVKSLVSKKKKKKMILWFLSLNSVFMVLKMAIFVGKVQSTETHIYFLSLNKIRIIVSQLLDVWLNTKLAKRNRFDSH